MSTDKLSRFWLLATFLLIISIIASGVLIWLRRDNGEPIRIVSSPPLSLQGEIYIDGAVANPGIYPLKANDNIESILQASGGADQNADFFAIHFYLPEVGETGLSQKVDINRADTWLLESLPDIGSVRAQNIVQYRQTNGPFQNIQEITQVEGISDATFQKIKDLITLSDGYNP